MTHPLRVIPRQTAWEDRTGAAPHPGLDRVQGLQTQWHPCAGGQVLPGQVKVGVGFPFSY